MRPLTISKSRARAWPIVFLSAILLVAACDRDNPTAPVVAGPSALHVSGVMGALYQSVRVRAGRPVTDAVVTVNGVAIPHCCGDLYSGKLPEAVPPGSQLDLTVSAGGLTVEATGYVLEAPIITAPATGSVLASTDFINVTWTSATDPDRFEVCLNCWENSLDGAIYQTPGTARDLKIAAGDLTDYGNGAIVAVYAMKEDFLSFTGTVAPGSRVMFVSRSPDAVFTIAP